MNILQVANGYPPMGLGGVEVYTHDLAQGLAQRGHALSVFCRHSDLALPDYHSATSIIEGVAVHRLVNDHKKSRAFRDTFIDARVEAEFRELVLRLQPDVIHFNHLVGLSARLPLIAGELNLPFIVTLHDFWPICHQVRLIDRQGRICRGPEMGANCLDCIGGAAHPQLGAAARLAKAILSPQARRRLRALLFHSQPIEAQPSALTLVESDLEIRTALFRRAVLSAARILAPSDYVRRCYSDNGYPAERIEVLPLGVGPAAQPPGSRRTAGADKPLILAAVGSFIPTKGLHTLIEAFTATPAANLRLQLHGRDDVDPSYTQQLKRLAGQDTRITFHGAFLPAQRSQIYQAIDVLALPAAAPETFSLVAREALVHNRPVIATRIGALPEIIIDGVNGFLFEPGSTAQLAQIFAHLAHDPSVLARLDLPGPVPVPSVDEHAASVEALYRKVLAPQAAS